MSWQSDATDESIAATACKTPYAFSLLVERYEQKLSRYVRRLGVLQSEDVEDILQNVFIKAYRNLQSFDTSLTFSSWIYRIAHNEVVSFYRKHKARPQGYYVSNGEEVIERIKADETTADFAERNLNAAELGAAMDRVPQKYRGILVLRYFEEREYKEISDILKIPIGSVATQIHRAKKALKKELPHHSDI